MRTDQMEAVADAGPIIHLKEIQQLRLLKIFAVLHIPDAIWDETVGQNRIEAQDLEKLKITFRHFISPEDTAQFTVQHNLKLLHSGELESLFLCYSLGILLILTDDLTVRDASKELDIRPVGSLGIVIRAMRLGIIAFDDAERYLFSLYHTSSLFVTRTIVEMAIEQLRTSAAD